MKSRLVYIVFSYSVQALNVILNLIFMQRLPAHTLGDLALAKIWLQGFDYTHLGTRFSLDRYLPTTTQKNHRAAYLLVSLAVVLAGSLLLLATAVTTQFKNNVVLIFCVVGFILATYNLFKAYFRATSNLLQVNRLICILYFVPLTISVAAAAYSFSLFLWVYPVVFALSALFLIVKNFRAIEGVRLTRIVFFPIINRMFAASKLLFINSIVVYAFLIIDRLFVDWSLGREGLGSYSVIMFVFASLFTVPSILTELIFPKIVREVVDSNKVVFLKEMFMIFFSTLLAIVLANVIMYFVVIRYTDYGHLLPLMQLASLGVLPYAFTSIIYHVFNALDRRYLLLKVNLIALIVYFVTLCVAFRLFSLWVFVLIKVLSSVVLLGFYLLALYNIKNKLLNFSK